LTPRRYEAIRHLVGLLRADRGLAALIALLRALERVALALATFAFVRESRADALVIGLGLGVVLTARSAATAVLLRRARLALLTATARSAVMGDVLAASVLPDEDFLLGVFDGLYQGERVAAEFLPGLVGDACAAATLAVFFVRVAPPHLLATAAGALATGTAGVLVARRATARIAARSDAAYMPVNDALFTAFGARLEIAASGRGGDFVDDVERRAEAWCREAMHADRLTALAGRVPLAAATVVVGLAVIFDHAVRGTLGAAAVGDAALVASIFPAFTGLSRSAVDLVKAEVKLRPLVELLTGARRPEGARPGTPLPPLPADVEWRGVDFAYPGPERDRPLAISDVSASWRRGALLALTGPNGSGKSTLLRLLLGLAAPTAGAVAVGGRDVLELDLVAWQKAVAFLPQRPFVPERATVREFVRLMAADASDDAIRRAARRVALLDALERSLPQAPLDVRVGTLSAGQRQRLALARVLCRDDARVFLLDEPDANLDAGGVALVAELVRELAADHMVAVAAHTREVVAAADQVIDLEPKGAALSGPPRADSPRSEPRATRARR
jgi:ABC-type multidrug transport system fused ATPase/permease subunit